MKDTGFDVLVPHKDLEPERKDECVRIMITGNAAYRRWLPFISLRRSRACRKNVIDGKLCEVLRFIPTDRHEEFMADVPAILRVESVISDMLACHVKMIIKFASRWHETNRSNTFSTKRSYFDGGDLASEGFIAMIDAIHNFDREDIRFITYAGNVVNRRMFAALMQTSPLACFNRREQNLLKKFIRHQLAAGEKKTLAQAIDDGVLAEKDASVVREILTVKVVLASVLEKSFGSGMGEDEVFDYTSLRRGAKDDTSNQPTDAWELYDFMDRANLSDIEQDALLSSMMPFRGWQTECSKRHKNRVGDGPVSKMAVSYALQRAVQKIRVLAGLEPGDGKLDVESLISTDRTDHYYASVGADEE